MAEGFQEGQEWHGFRHPMAGLVPSNTADDLARALGLVGSFRAVLPPQHVDEIGDQVSFLSRWTDARIRMVVARRVGAPLSEVTERWTHEDLIAELAWDAILSADHWKRCPNCGTAADEVLDENGKVADDSMWKLYLDTCVTCGELERVNKQLRDAGDGIEPGTYWRPKPRAPGDPWRDDGGILDSDD